MADESSQKSTIQKSVNQESVIQESVIQELPTEIAKPIIAQCRREIAAGWTQIEAARTDLKRTRVLHERWSELMKAAAAVAAAASPSEELSHDRPRSEGFVMVPALKRRRSRRRSAS
jgi:hypothetical protein